MLSWAYWIRWVQLHFLTYSEMELCIFKQPSQPVKSIHVPWIGLEGHDVNSCLAKGGIPTAFLPWEQLNLLPNEAKSGFCITSFLAAPYLPAGQHWVWEPLESLLHGLIPPTHHITPRQKKLPWTRYPSDIWREDVSSAARFGFFLFFLQMRWVSS